MYPQPPNNYNSNIIFNPIPLRPSSNNNGYLNPTPAFAASGLTRPTSQSSMEPSSVGSLYGRENNNSLSLTNRNSNLGSDQGYEVTQSDLTLEGLSERWHTYQETMKKRYAEVPFYRRWTKSKWILLFSALLLLGYSCAVFAISLGYILDKFELAAVAIEFHSSLIYLSLSASIMGIACSLIGLVGIFQENRIWLSWYTTLLWPAFALYVSVGYIAFRRVKNHLRAHIKDDWIHSYTRDQRLVVQRNLKCCGYQDPSYYGEYDLRCFPMINLPGCQHKYNLYEHNLLTTCWTYAFSIVPVQLFVMISALLCANHVDDMLRSARPGLKSFKEEKEE
ncbi:hypothetical protein BGZ65_003253 [Modicella reniformis]|uniref:Tetraspanin Tsp2 n=1 Tax=Modicella reniformis TaxID=1440133 RepID=A0A9P6J088_9FUNG|nr:hypothetical protein BGZ65_003253 [Modicella reniformis]